MPVYDKNTAYLLLYHLSFPLAHISEKARHHRALALNGLAGLIGGA